MCQLRFRLSPYSLTDRNSRQLQILGIPAIANSRNSRQLQILRILGNCKFSESSAIANSGMLPNCKLESRNSEEFPHRTSTLRTCGRSCLCSGLRGTRGVRRRQRGRRSAIAFIFVRSQLPSIFFVYFHFFWKVRACFMS